MSIKFEFLFDFGSPNAYFVHRVIKGVEERTGVAVEYIPVLLGGIFKATKNQSPFMAYANIPSKMNYERIEGERFVKKHGIAEYQRNEHFPVNTLTIMRGAVAAQKLGCFDTYVNVVFKAMWEQSLKMDDPEVIASFLTENGLDAKAILEACSEQGVKDALMANTNSAIERGAFGIPTFFINNEIFFGKDRLRDVEDYIEELK